MSTPHSSSFRLLVGLAAFVIVMAGIQAAAPLLVTLLLSGFIAILCAPAYLSMLRYRVPAPVALIALIAALLFIQVGLVSVLATSMSQLSNDLPIYQERLSAALASGTAQINETFGVSVSKDLILRHLDPSLGVSFAKSTLSSLGSIASNVFVVLLVVVFTLLETAGFRHKLQHAFGKDVILAGATDFVARVKLYMTIKTGLSIATGALVYLMLKLIGVDYALVWAVMAFLLNFVPSIGSIFAAVPAVLMTLIQLGGLDALLVIAGYAVINVSIGNLLEPRLMGRGMGLSPLVVFLSLIFWYWSLGPVGMLLAVPLTVLAKLALGASEDTRWMAVLLGPDMSDKEFLAQQEDR